jgi:hypothetical protein
MKDGFIFQGTSSNKIDDCIEKDSDIKEGNQSHYLYPQNLYQFLNPNNMGIKEYNYEWTRAFHTFFSQIVAELGKECDGRTCSIMSAGKDWQFKCMSYGTLKNITWCAIEYCIHTLDTNICLLSNPAYFRDREKISDCSAKALSKTVRYLYRMLGYIYYHHKKLFNSLLDRYRIGERLTL